MRRAAFVLVAAIAAVAVFHSSAAAWPAVHRTTTQSYPLTADGSVAIDDSSGDVTVTGWSNDSIQVTIKTTAWSTDDLNRLGATIDPASDRISIAATYPHHCMNCDVSFDVKVPVGAHVSIGTSSGDISVTSVSGPVRTDASSGDVELHDIAGDVRAHTSSGDLKLDHITGSVSAFVSSGDIDATGLADDVDLGSSSGSVSASFATFDRVRSVRLDSASGDVELTVPRGVGFDLEATTSSGSIDSNLDLPIRDRSAGATVSARVGSGKAAVEMRTTSGDISVKMR